MVATQTQLRRGTEGQCDAMTPAAGEIVVDTTNKRVRLGDGSTAGGIEIPNATDIQKGMFNTVNATGTNTITVTLDPVPASYFTNMTVIIKAAATNTGAVTLNVNSLGAKNIYKVSGGALGPLSAGDLVIGAYYTVRYDGTQFVLEGSAGGVSSLAATDTSLTVSASTGAVTAGINTNNAGGVGCIGLFQNVSGSVLANGATIAGSSLRYIAFRSFDSTIEQIGTPSGTWRSISGGDLFGSAGAGEQNIGLFIRTA